MEYERTKQDMDYLRNIFRVAHSELDEWRKSSLRSIIVSGETLRGLSPGKPYLRHSVRTEGPQFC